MLALALLLLAAAPLSCVAKLGGRGRTVTPHVDVVIFANPAYAVGVAAAINSSRFHTTNRIRVFVGFDGDPDVLLQYLACVGVDATDVYVRRPVELVDRADIPKASVRKDNTRPGLDKSRLANAANYARFTITTSFPEVKTAWYIDSDALPVADLGGREYTEFVRSGRLIQPAIRSGTIERQFDRAVLPIYMQKYGRRFKLGAPSWNAGVWLADFAQWEKLHVAEEAVFWVTQANEFAAQGLGRLWKLNTQPIMYLLFHDSTRKPAQFLAHGWNCESVDYEIADAVPRGCRIIHWNGGEKPWVPSANGHALWRQYLPRFDVKDCAALVYVPPPPAPEPPDAPAEEADGGGGGEVAAEGGADAGAAGDPAAVLPAVLPEVLPAAEEPASPAEPAPATAEPEQQPEQEPAAAAEPAEGAVDGGLPPEGGGEGEGAPPPEGAGDAAGAVADPAEQQEGAPPPPEGDAAPADAAAADAPPGEPAAPAGEAPADAPPAEAAADAPPPDAPAAEQPQEGGGGEPAAEAPPAPEGGEGGAEQPLPEEGQQPPAAAEGGAAADNAGGPPPEDPAAAAAVSEQPPTADGDAAAAAPSPAPRTGSGPLSWIFGN